MIYQYDLALEMPTMDVYDSGMLGQYINALKDDYNRGIADQKEFTTKYGDFTSPSKKDVENWYNLGLGSVLDVMLKALENGIDPLRTQEGRSLILQAISRVPYLKLAMLKQSAKAQEEFNQAKKQLAAKGLYNKELSQYEGGIPEEYDTLASGKAWDVASPTPYQDVATFSDPYFKHITPRVSSINKNGMLMEKSVIDEQMLRDIADQKFNELVKTPQGALMYKQYLSQANGDTDAARKMFNNALVAANESRLVNNEKVDDNWLKKQQLNIEYAKLNLERQKAAAEIAKTAADNQVMQWTQERQLSSDKGLNDSASARVLDAILNQIDVNTWRLNHKLNTTKEQKQSYKNYIDHWQRALKDPVKYGYVGADGRATADGMRIYRDMLRAKSPHDKHVSNVDEYYNSMSFNITGGTPEGQLASSLFTGDNKAGNMTNDKLFNGFKSMSFANTNLQLTAQRKRSVLGYAYVHNSDAKKLIQYLRKNKVVCYAQGDQITGAMIPTQTGRQLDLSGYVYLSKANCDAIKKEVCGNDDKRFMELLNNVGGSVVKMNKTQDQYNAFGKKNMQEEVVMLPVTRTIDNDGGMTFNQLNQQMNKSRYGGSKNYDEAPNAAAASIMQTN